MLKLKVNNGRLSIVQNQTFTSYSINYYKIQIDFPENWNDFEKYATFYQNPEDERYVTKIPSNGIVTLPIELQGITPCFVGVYGVLDSTRATTNNVKIRVIDGSYRPNMIEYDGTGE